MSMVMFWVIYAPNWVFLNGEAGSRYLLLILLFLSIDITKLVKPESVSPLTISSNALALLTSLTGVVIFLTCIPVVHSTYDFSLSTQLIQAIPLYVVFAWLIHKILGKLNWDLPRLLWLMSSVIFFQSIAVVLDWVFPEVRNVFERIVVHPEALLDVSVRAAGLSSSTGDGLAFVQACGAMFSFFLLARTRGYWRRALLGLMFWTQVVSIVFLGRTGFVLLTTFVAVQLLFSRNRKEQLRALMLLASVPALLVVGLYVLMPETIVALIDSNQLAYAFEFIYNYLEGGRLATSSTDEILTTEFILPLDEAALWFGNGRYTNPITGSNYIDADPGYVRTVFYAGIFGSIVVYGWLLFLWHSMLARCEDAESKTFVSSFFIVLFVSHLKFPFLYLGVVFALLSLFFAFQEKEKQVRAQPDQVRMTPVRDH
jgi:hypothetical protein